LEEQSTSEPGGHVRRSIAVLLLLVCFATIAWAQAPATSFAEMQSRLHVGETVLVTDDAGQTVTGVVERMADDVLTIQTDGRDRQIAAATVQRVVRVGHAAGAGALIGLVAGFAVGALIATSDDCTHGFGPCFNNAGGVMALGGLFGGIGAGIGAVAGAASRTERVVFERPANGAHAAVTPLLSRRGAGFLVRVSF
jgi:hypothetical protein